MKLADLEASWMEQRRQGRWAIVFNCPGGCCAAARERQARAAELEAAGDPGAPAARHAAFMGQPFRVIVAVSRPEHKPIEKLYTTAGDIPAFQAHPAPGLPAPADHIETITIVEEVDRTPVGHARVRITNGEVEVL